MEEDVEAQAQPGGQQQEEEPEQEPSRCGRHPSQLLTGICSSCLMERLSSVRDQPEAEIVEVGAAEGSAAAAATDPSKLRKTLMLLFQLDDSSGGPGVGVAHPPGEMDSQVGGFPVDHGGDRGGKRKSASWLRSILPRRVRWGRGGGSGKAPSLPPREVLDPSGGGNGAGVQVERKPSFRRSCEWMACREPSRRAPEPPRHSWDGSMVGRAFACSFACLDEPPDAEKRASRSNAEEVVGDNCVRVAESRNGRHSVDAGSEERRFRGRTCADPGMEIIGRRRSNRWSRVWDRSITSPLKEFVRKGEHVLERSLSESRKEIRRGKNVEAADISGEIHRGRNGHVSGRASQGAIRSSQSQAASNGDAQNFRADWLKNSKIGRSRSVHYTSPGNLDNGMLRFYLTPMRSTRAATRGRRRSSRLFARGLFGFI